MPKIPRDPRLPAVLRPEAVKSKLASDPRIKRPRLPEPALAAGLERRALHVGASHPRPQHPMLQARAPLPERARPLDSGPVAQLVPPPKPAALAGPRPMSAARKAFDALPVPTIAADVQLLEDNDDAWLANWRALSHANGPIDATYYIHARDAFGMAFLGKLLENALEGHPVRLMNDDTGDAFGQIGFTKPLLGKDYLRELARVPTAEVRLYHPLEQKVRTFFRRDAQPFASLANNHDKILRTPTQVIAGGRNVANYYFGVEKDKPGNYRDCDLAFFGADASEAFAEPFEAEWNRRELTRTVKPLPLDMNVRRDLELLGASTMMDLWLNRRVSSDVARALRSTPEYRTQTAEKLMESALEELPSKGIHRKATASERKNLWKVATELVTHVNLLGALHRRSKSPRIPGAEVKLLDRISAAGPVKNEISTGLATIAAGASRRIILHNPYVVLTEDALAALEAAGKRGVQIELVTNSPKSSDSIITQAFFLEDWARMLARVPNMRIFVLGGTERLHGKTGVADEELSLVSSYNLDLLSEQVNGELAAVVSDPRLARQMRRSHDALLEDPSRRIREYTILRHPDGSPVLRNGEPVPVKGPEQLMTPWQKVKSWGIRGLLRLARRLPALKSIAGIPPPRALPPPPPPED